MDGVTPWPDDFAARYRMKGYWQDRVLSDHVDEWGAQYGDREALWCQGNRYSYFDLMDVSVRLAVRLLDLGIKPGDRVVVQLPNVAEFVALTFALFRIGAMPVMALPPHRHHEISYIVEHAEAIAYAIPDTLGDFDFRELASQLQDEIPSLNHILVAGEPGTNQLCLSEMLKGAIDLDAAKDRLGAVKPDPDDVALFLLSGGTTGLPKLIPRSHNDYAYNFRQSGAVCEFDASTVYMVCLPIAHNFPLGCPGALGTFHMGGRVVLAPSPRPDLALSLIEQEKVTHTAAVPAVAISWLNAPEAKSADCASLKVLQVGGARFNPEAAKRVKPEIGATVQQVFGMAEGLLNYTRLDDPEEEIINTQGRPICPDDEILIVDENGDPVPDEEPGELLTRGPYTLRGYYKDGEVNARAFTRDGFYRTGDVVRKNVFGNFLVEGREKDLINRGGEKISAEEIENLILAHHAVANVAAVAAPDPVLGERVCAYVVMKDRATLSLKDLRDFMAAQNIAKFKLPERLEIIDVLPVTNVGKIDKKALRDDIAGKMAWANRFS